MGQTCTTGCNLAEQQQKARFPGSARAVVKSFGKALNLLPVLLDQDWEEQVLLGLREPHEDIKQGPQRPPKHKDPTLWLGGSRQSGFQQPAACRMLDNYLCSQKVHILPVWGLWFQKLYHVWCFEPESLNGQYMEPLGFRWSYCCPALQGWCLPKPVRTHLLTERSPDDQDSADWKRS